MKVEHIGIAVKDLSQANRCYEKLLGFPPYKFETVDSEGVNTSFFQAGDSKIELLEATHPQSPISRFIDKKGEGIHHIAFEVADIFIEIQRLKKEGFEFINELPKQGADNKLVCFVYPKLAHGVLIEICQTIKS
ncbi:MAG: methylmalonyl-CoA epimerase [Bacteroidetes bacterium]|nr:methylmalonyl-CoA epimerase [Bacteroidota bacterium]